MAGQIRCDVCGSEPATVMQSALGDGTTTAIGDDCLIPVYAGVIAGLLEAMPEQEAAWYRDAIQTMITPQPAAPPDDTPPGKPGRKHKPAAAPPPPPLADGYPDGYDDAIGIPSAPADTSEQETDDE